MYFGCWVALENTDHHNAPLAAIPGSHRLPLFNRDEMARKYYSDLSKIKDIDTERWEEYQQQLLFRCDRDDLKAQEVHVGKADAIIWHPLLAHSGAQINDLYWTRMSFVMHTTPRDVPVFHTDVFFNANRPVPRKAPWCYDVDHGRLMMHTSHLAIGHDHPKYDFSKLS